MKRCRWAKAYPCSSPAWPDGNCSTGRCGKRCPLLAPGREKKKKKKSLGGGIDARGGRFIQWQTSCGTAQKVSVDALCCGSSPIYRAHQSVAAGIDFLAHQTIHCRACPSRLLLVERLTQRAWCGKAPRTALGFESLSNLDRFKTVNDTWAHAGMSCLRVAGEPHARLCREEDTALRVLVRDEFVNAGRES